MVFDSADGWALSQNELNNKNSKVSSGFGFGRSAYPGTSQWVSVPFEPDRRNSYWSYCDSTEDWAPSQYELIKKETKRPSSFGYGHSTYAGTSNWVPASFRPGRKRIGTSSSTRPVVTSEEKFNYGKPGIKGESNILWRTPTEPESNGTALATEVDNFVHFTRLTGDGTCNLPWKINMIPFCCATRFFHYRPFCSYIRATGHLPHQHHHEHLHRTSQSEPVMQMGGWIG